MSLHGVESVTKTWIPNTNYDNPSNWDLGRVPSYNDRVIFPSEMESAVQLRDGATTVRELVLPSNGEILLPFTGSLVVTGKSRPESEDVVFTRSWAAAWLDPDNWLTEGRRASRAVPHLERIPCTHDRILFPEGSSFRVRLPEVVVTVGTISLLGQVPPHPDPSCTCNYSNTKAEGKLTLKAMDLEFWIACGPITICATLLTEAARHL
ncbi:hypothetical protein ANN_06165 [Periplaneta americana]|uniref:Protein amnionless n=1 Tax=Periplaneta americana TaxID=6978 RepID=A0ABQ8TCT2_PERAM|nr:hypothetical protein ANN_06165 [Periplaneta americana]